MSGFSRRGFLKGLAVATGAAVGTRLAGGSFIGNALAAGEPTSVVVIHFIGGYNAIGSSAAPLTGSVGVVAGNYTDLGNGVTADSILADAYSPFVKQHVATICVNHGQSSHPCARRSLWDHGGGKCYAHELAAAIGGTGSNKALIAGAQDLKGDRPVAPVNGVAFQNVLDMKSFLDSIGGGGPGPRDPDRTVSLAGLANAQTMSKNTLDGSPVSLLGLRQGYSDAVSTLKLPPATIDLPAIQAAYGLGASTNVNTFKSKMAAAELFVQSGTNVVSIFEPGWDTHGDNNGNTVRNMMTPMMAPLKTFLDRMVTASSSRNVVVCLMGDFARSLPGSNHQPNLSATVIGKYVQRGTTGKVNADVAVGAGTPSSPALWSYLAAAGKVASAPFGANPHNLVL
ncbi:hypothetical protein BH11MYX4_BH11MYX4_63810 [soil metagenome]